MLFEYGDRSLSVSEREKKEVLTEKQKYDNMTQSIKSVSTGIGPKITDLLNNWPTHFSTLKCLLIFLNSPRANHLERLLSGMERFLLTPFEKRIIWTFYGMLHGISVLGHQFKRHRSSLFLSDLLAHWVLPNDLSNALFPKPKKYDYSNIQVNFLPKPFQDNDSDLISVQLITGLGLPLNAIVVDSLEKLRKRIIKELNNRHFEENLKRILIESEKSNEYIQWEIKLSGKFAVRPEKFQNKIYSKNEPIIQKQWPNKAWIAFKKKYIGSKDGFKKLCSESDIRAKIENLLK